jgi:hypothetical protein
MSQNAYHLIPAYGKVYRNEAEIRQDWENGVTFRVLDERGSYMNSRDYEKYCNPMDGVYYCFDGLFVQLIAEII